MSAARGLAAVLVALMASAASALADPPRDVREACASAYSNAPTLVPRCVTSEQQAKDRVERQGQAHFGVDRQTWNACYRANVSWQGMATCLSQGVARPPATGNRGNLTDSLNRASEAMKNMTDRTREYRDATREATEATKDARDVGIPPAPAAPVGPPPNIVIFEPRTSPAPAPPTADEPARPTRPITADEAREQTKRAVERAGKPGAKCTTKMYGSGAVTVCE